jgi:Na+/H+-dicarboxylate symporter
MSSTTRVLVGLVAGLGLGAALAGARAPGDDLIAVAGLVGTLWLDALRMTIVPMVFALLVTGTAAAATTAAAGGVAARSLLLFGGFLAGAALLGALAAPALLALSPIGADDAAVLRASVPGAGVVPELPPFTEWLKTVIPKNPIAAAAESAMVPLVVFALLFGLAATRIQPAQRLSLVGFFEAVAATMLVMVRWVLWAAPLGVFALSLVVGMRAGIGAAGAILHYVLVIVAVCVLVTAAVYVVVLAARVPLRRFARAAAPAQAVALSTQSSLACLPAMVEGAERDLGVPAGVTGLVLPLAVSLLRVTSPPANVAVALYVGSLYGVDPGALQIAAAAAMAVIVSVALVSLPSQITFFTGIAPVCLAMGVPIDALPLLLAVETIPDIFRTLGNVTADLAVTAIVGRDRGQPGSNG